MKIDPGYASIVDKCKNVDGLRGFGEHRLDVVFTDDDVLPFLALLFSQA
ncbi:MAG: hypothetical protein WC997_04455 [Porticoccaceae bacterium]